MSTRTTTRRRPQAPPAPPPAHGVARWLSHPWAPSAACNEGQAGLCLISSVPYLVTILGIVQDGEFLLDGVRLTRSEGKVYDVDFREQRCDCPDGTFRSHRPTGCKHQAALRVLLPIAGIPVPPRGLIALDALDRRRQPTGYRSAADFAGSDPDAWEGHCLDLAGPDEAA